MIGGLVEIAEDGRHLSVHRGFLKVSDSDRELGRVPPDGITALILPGPRITLSKTLMVELAERKAAIVTCDRNWHPVSFSLPFGAHYEAAGILKDQVGASEPLKKRLWKQIVRARISNQAIVLMRHAPDARVIGELDVLRRRVKSGDPENMEAQAARHHRPALMGRNSVARAASNALLNYGYTVVRAATARAVCGSGLHPALGLHHGSRVNPFALIDDLMEPFRPLVDSTAHDIAGAGGKLSTDQKRSLAAVLREDVVSEVGLTPVVNGLARLAQSPVCSLADKRPQLVIPAIWRPGQFL